MRQQQNNWKQGRWNQEQRMKTHAKCHKDGHHRQSATMTKNRGQDHQNGKNNGQRQARRQAEIARGGKKKSKEDGAMKQKATTRRSKIQKNKRTKKTGNTHKNMQNRNTKKTRKKKQNNSNCSHILCGSENLISQIPPQQAPAHLPVVC